MRTSVLRMALALLLLGMPIAAASPAAATQTPTATVPNQAATTALSPARSTIGPRSVEPSASVLPGVRLDALFGRVPQRAATCPICPLTLCAAPGLRCDYESCTTKCCQFSCYQDPSCTSWSCVPHACNSQVRCISP